MKTKVRTFHVAKSDGFHHLQIQVLDHPSTNTDEVEPIGYITFQSNHNEPDNWYGMSFRVESDKAENFIKIGKLIKFIKSNRENWNDQPDKIKKLIGAVEYGLFNTHFMPLSNEGLMFFKLFNSIGEYYSHIIAANKVMAQKALDKFDGLHGYYLDEGTEIKF